MNILLSITAISDMQTNKAVVRSDRISEVWLIAYLTDELILPAFFFDSSLILPSGIRFLMYYMQDDCSLQD